MANVIAVKFKNNPKIYYVCPNQKQYGIGDQVIVEITGRVECITVCKGNHEREEQDLTLPLAQVIRPASSEDLKILEENKQKEQKAFHICLEKIEKNHLKMKLIEVHYTFDHSKILFYFTADGRIDFRQLVKDLARVFRKRIELRQIGVRDEAKMLGGMGICGLPFCCGKFANSFQSVSIKMAKEQGLSLNPAKISGNCGRLMCCLKYEQKAYESLAEITPSVGAQVITPQGKGCVNEVNLMSGAVYVTLAQNLEAGPQKFHRNEIELLGKKMGCGKKNPPFKK